MRALIFDFNGVITDDEPLHLEAFQRVLAEIGVPLFAEEYYREFLGMDDRGCFRAVLERRGKPTDDGLIGRLIQRKSEVYTELIRHRLALFPEVDRFIRQAAERYPLAIASGALRDEIESILRRADLRSCFRVIVAAEDVREGKPDPEPFLTALAWLNQIARPPLRPEECVVLEDSPWGIRAARAAGMPCVAITHSYSAQELSDADLVVNEYQEGLLERIESLNSGE